jgi:5-methylcytosine-specific restriction endonuclease McrA
MACRFERSGAATGSKRPAAFLVTLVSVVDDRCRQYSKAKEIHNVQGKVTTKNLLLLAEQQQYRCALTGVELTTETVSLDHIKPVHKDGADDMSNVQLVHSTINAMKGTLAQDEFVEWCKLVSERFGAGIQA